MAPFRSERLAQKPYSRYQRPPVSGQWLHDKAEDGGKNGIKKTGKPIPNNKLIVTNLHYEVTEKDLTSIFGQIGTLIREPQIRYDRSGRSSGTAFITYESIAEATRAMKQYDGILAKGQPMTIAYDATPARRVVSAPTTASLLNRIQKPALLDRLSKDDMAVDIRASNSKQPRTAGPIRNRRGGAKPVTKKQPKKPKTADELDKELEAMMDDNTAEPDTSASAKVQEKDVEMTS